MFYYGSTFELYIELVEPGAILDDWIKEPLKDGMRFSVFKEGQDRKPVKVGILGNKDTNSYISYNYHIDKPEKEGMYLVCLSPSDSIYNNAAVSGEQSGSSLFGRVFQENDYSKLSFEVSLTLERVFHGAFQTTQDLEQAHESTSNREQMAATNVITHKSMDQID